MARTPPADPWRIDLTHHRQRCHSTTRGIRERIVAVLSRHTPPAIPAIPPQHQ